MLEQFVVVNDEISSLVFDIRYYSSDNFLGTKVRGYESAKCILTRPASEALKKAQRELTDATHCLASVLALAGIEMLRLRFAPLSMTGADVLLLRSLVVV